MVGTHACERQDRKQEQATPLSAKPRQGTEELSFLSEDVYHVGVAGIQDSRPGWGSEARRFPELNPTEKARLQE